MRLVHAHRDDEPSRLTACSDPSLCLHGPGGGAEGYQSLRSATIQGMVKSTFALNLLQEGNTRTPLTPDWSPDTAAPMKATYRVPGSATNLTSTFGGQAMPSAESPYPSLLVVWLHSMRSRWSSTFPSASVTAVTVIWPSLWADRKAPVIHQDRKSTRLNSS